MIKKTILVALSVLGLAAFVGVAAASAAEEFHTSGTVGEKVSGSQTITHTISVEGSEASCETAELEGEVLSETGVSFGVAPVYGGCKAFGFKEATFQSSECVFTFNSKTTAGHATWALSGCANGGLRILVSIPFIAKCTVHIKNQTGINRVSYENSVNKKEMTIKLTSTGIHSEVLSSTGACPLKVGTNTATTYSGSSKMTAAGGGQLFWE